MSKALETLRLELARAVGRIQVGIATGGTTTTLVDTNGLARYTENDALKGALLYIASAGSAAPEGEARRITGYTASTNTLTVEYAFTAAPAASDTYHIYKAPLSLEEWDQAINDAIKGAWPELVEPATEDVSPTGAYSYSLSAAADKIIGAEVIFEQSPEPYTLLFDGASGEVDIGNPTVLNNLPSLGDFTVEAWINPLGWGENQQGMIFDKYYWYLKATQISNRGIEVRATYDSQEAISYTGYEGFNVDGDWHHIAAVWSGTAKQWDIAIDGVWATASIQAGLGTYTADSAFDLTIGNTYLGNNTFDGYVGWVRISDEHRYIPGTNFTAPSRCIFPESDSLTIGQWIHEGTGSTVEDESDNENDGTLAGATWASCPCASVIAGAPSQPVVGWYQVGEPGSLTLKLSRPVFGYDPGIAIRVYTGQRYDELAAGESTELDPEYILAAAQSNIHGALAGIAQVQKDVAANLQLMAHWQEQAAKRKAELVGKQAKEDKKK